MASETIPKVQLALVAVKKGKDFKVEAKYDFPVPEIKDDEVLVRLTSSGVCHSDLSFIDGEWGQGLQIQVDVAGHEGNGYIVKHGKLVDSAAYPVGTKVGVPLVYNPCRTCSSCVIPNGEAFCVKNKFYACHLDGTWQQYIAVHSQYIIPVPDLPEDEAYQIGPILCGGVTVYKGLRQANAKAGQTIVITGAGGGLGSMAIQYAVALGLRVIAVDTSDEKEKLTKKLGAETFIDYAKDDIVKGVLSATNGLGANIALSLAPTESAYNQTLQYLSIQGTLVCIGLPRVGVNLTFPPSLAIFKGIKIVGSLVGSRTDLLEALDFLGRGKVKVPVTVYKPDQIQKVLENMAAGKLEGRAVIDLR